MEKIILFDLDGTLTESGDGITKSVQYALKKLGKPEPNIEKLQVFIGPPLLQQFMEYADLTREEGEQAVIYYRERYAKTGIFENKLYPGVTDMLKALKEKGMILAVASSKPEKYVRQIVEYFHIDQYFDEIVGALMNGERTAKIDVIEEALRRLHVGDSREKVIMVGDKEHDVKGASQAGICCIAVSYGYGTRSELEMAKPWKIADSTREVSELLLSCSQSTEPDRLQL